MTHLEGRRILEAFDALTGIHEVIYLLIHISNPTIFAAGGIRQSEKDKETLQRKCASVESALSRCNSECSSLREDSARLNAQNEDTSRTVKSLRDELADLAAMYSVNGALVSELSNERDSNTKLSARCMLAEQQVFVLEAMIVLLEGHFLP